MLHEKFTEFEQFDLYRREFGDNYGHVNSSPSPVESILSAGWQKAKREYLFDLFGGELILKKKITIQKNFNIFSNELDYMSLRTNEEDNDIHNFKSEVRKIKSLVESPRGVDLKYLILTDLLSIPSLYYNKIMIRDISYISPSSGRIVTLKVGSKLMKALRKIVEDFNVDREIFEKFRIKISQLTNQREFKGTLCLSIHPLDYLTMSDNGCNWSSCMSWRDKGCYRQGTVEMMNSKSVVVAYLEGSSNYSLPFADFEWSNKKWRELFFINEDYIVPIKGYPYESRELEETVLNWLKDLAEKNLNLKFEDKMRSVFPLLHTNYMYDDLHNGKVEKFGYVDAELACSEDFHKIIELTTYSGPSQCMWCGELNSNDIVEAAYLFCSKCEKIFYCESCGDMVSGDNSYLLNNPLYPETHLCNYCYHNTITICSECSYDFYNEDVIADPTIILPSHLVEQYMPDLDSSKNYYLSFNSLGYYALCKDCIQKFLKKAPEDYYEIPITYIDLEALPDSWRDSKKWTVDIF